MPEAKPYRVDTFNQFVRDFESKLNQLRLVELAVKIYKDLDNPQTQLEFLTSLRPRLSKNAQDGPAGVLLLATIAHAKLMYGDVEGSKTDMDEAFKKLEEVSEGPDMEAGVRAACYGVGADYYKAKGEYSPYYRNSLLFLACIDVERDITPEDRLMRAHDLAISAFLSEDIYNFGELVSLFFFLQRVYFVKPVCEHSSCTRYYLLLPTRLTIGSRSCFSPSTKGASASSKPSPRSSRKRYVLRTP